MPHQPNWPLLVGVILVALFTIFYVGPFTAEALNAVNEAKGALS